MVREFPSWLDRRRHHQIVDDTRVKFGSFFWETNTLALLITVQMNNLLKIGKRGMAGRPGVWCKVENRKGHFGSRGPFPAVEVTSFGGPRRLCFRICRSHRPPSAQPPRRGGGQCRSGPEDHLALEYATITDPPQQNLRGLNTARGKRSHTHPQHAAARLDKCGWSFLYTRWHELTNNPLCDPQTKGVVETPPGGCRPICKLCLG